MKVRATIDPVQPSVIAPGPGFQPPSETDFAMAAAEMHSMGRLFEPEPTDSKMNALAKRGVPSEEDDARAELRADKARGSRQMRNDLLGDEE